MIDSVFNYLNSKYKYLNDVIEEIDKNIFISPHTAIIKCRIFAEYISKEVCRFEGYDENQVNNMTQNDRIRILRDDGIFTKEIADCFYVIKQIGNKAAHNLVIEGELEEALKLHRNIYRIICWFIEVYLDCNFEAEPYKSPTPQSSQLIGVGEISDIINRAIDNKFTSNVDNQSTNKELNFEEEKNKEEAFIDLKIEGIFSEEPNKRCLVQQLAMLKESSKEAVESIGDFTSFKKYMHVTRDVQSELEDLIIKSNDSNSSQLILVCGSVGDGKSHIISYFNNKYPNIMKNFTLHNDATESLEPDKTSMDTLNDILDDFSDDKIEVSNKKLILAINLGTLNNFIDSNYAHRFSKLRKFVLNKKILENVIEDSSFDKTASFQYINFSDYHLYTLNNGSIESKYIKSIIGNITQSKESEDFKEKNIFFESYKKNCTNCEYRDCCPIKFNYELLGKENVQNEIIGLLVQCIVKNKIIISTRALLNFIYELIIPIAYIDVNAPKFKEKIGRLNLVDYIKTLMPNILFNHKELSFIFEALNSMDPLNIRNRKVDDFIIDYNNSEEVMSYFREYLDFPIKYLNKVSEINFTDSEGRNVKPELLRLFIRSYYLCGINDLFSLKDEVYEDYMKALFNWNRGEKGQLKEIYNNVKNGILKWNGDAGKDNINIFMGKSQTKYSVSELITLKADTNNLVNNNSNDLKKFIGTLKLRYKTSGCEESYEIDVDYDLYKLLIQVDKGYRPNKKDKNHYIKFIEFINKLQNSGSQNEEIIIIEKNKEHNRKFKLEFDEEFESYRFMEI